MQWPSAIASALASAITNAMARAMAGARDSTSAMDSAMCSARPPTSQQLGHAPLHSIHSLESSRHSAHSSRLPILHLRCNLVLLRAASLVLVLHFRHPLLLFHMNFAEN